MEKEIKIIALFVISDSNFPIFVLLSEKHQHEVFNKIISSLSFEITK